ncbi:mRNA decay protein [Coemansia thaxteri]|uniref:mRNA decay protein n=1 Tax=Coemansia thaxteri TaxID=2663907 RepID=A0A9W8EKX8_9FUNG|nr:mRNA decay protein [Coemansia thaxteri]KAJ2009936.1 mRNA decay protein [Coemansia thaxteri]KAJ2474278.1 mRNA decay protein [Coemansia sp. RSA 2322]KAJ2481656.1 mRNA decay protein [Coemansia sp. RSA 2320]
MDESTLKRHERLQVLQRANVDSWSGHAAKLDAGSLDTNMKKNTGFIKRCKASMGQESAAQLLREVRLLKLEKYVSEIVPAAAEGLLRCKTGSDVQASAEVMSALHARFPSQFTVPLIRALLKALSPPSVAALAAMSPEQRERDEQSRLARQKTLLRVLAEMYLSGLLWGIDALQAGVDGLDRAAAFTLSHVAQAGSASGTASSSSNSSSQSKFAARVRDMVQQPGHCVLLGALQNLFLADKEHHLSILLAAAFARAFQAEFALTDSDIPEHSAGAINAITIQDETAEQVVSTESCKRIKAVIHDYLDSAITHLENMNRTLTQMRRGADERLFTKGIVHADTKERIEKHTKSFGRLSESVTMLCEALGRTPPHFDDAIDDAGQLGIVFDAAGDAASTTSGHRYKQWEDEEERTFYETVLDLQSMLPPSMLTIRRKKPKSSASDDKNQPSTEQQASRTLDQPSAELPTDSVGADASITEIGDINEDDINVDLQPLSGDFEDADDDPSEPANALGLLEYQKYMTQRRGGTGSAEEQSHMHDVSCSSTPAKARANKDEDAPLSATRAAEPKAAEGDAAVSGPDGTAVGADGTMTIVQQSGANRTLTQTSAPMSFSTILRRLPTMTSKESVDQTAVSFCYVNSKVNRASLTRALVDVPRRQQFLLPYYARFIAVLHPFFPEIGEGVLEELSHEFHWLSKQRFKDLMETRLKNVKYIAELTKFKVAPLHISFRCAKITLEQFHAQNVEVLCALLEGCGRFLLAQPATSDRVASLLEILVRKRRALNLDERTNLLIDNACQACNPMLARAEQAAKYRTPYERYIRKLVYEDLSRTTVDYVTQKLRKLPWAGLSQGDPQRVRHALVSCFSKIWKTKYSNVYLVTMVMYKLGQEYPWFRVAVVDTVMERIKLGLERNLFSHNQRRVAEARYVGEMLIYKVIDAKEVLGLLYVLISHGHCTPLAFPGRSCEHDLSGDCFRVRLVCTILSTCGQFIRDPGAVEALERYMLHFQLYVLAKDQPLPVDIDYSLESLFETVFPKFARYGAWDEAARVVQGLVQGQNLASHGTTTNTAASEPPSSRSVITPSSVPAADATAEIDYDASAADTGVENSGLPSPTGAGEANGADACNGPSEELTHPLSSKVTFGSESDEYDEDAQLEALEALLEQEEEEQLEHEFNRLMLDSVEVRKTERIGKLEMGIPMNLIGRSTALSGVATSAESTSGVDEAAVNGQSSTSAEEQNAIKFSLLMGKKQRPVVHEVNIPMESQMARKIRLQEETALKEKAHLKQFVLNYERREAEEEQRLYERDRERLLAAMRARVSGANRVSASTDSAHQQFPARTAVPGATFVNKQPAVTPRKRHGSRQPMP